MPKSVVMVPTFHQNHHFITSHSVRHFHWNIIYSLQSKLMTDLIIFPPKPGSLARFTWYQHSLSQQDSLSRILTHFATKAFFQANYLPGVPLPPPPTGRFTHVIVLPFLLSKGIWAIVLSKQTLVIVISSHKQRYLMFLWSVPPASIYGIHKPSEEKCSALLLFEGNLTILKNKIKPNKFNTDLSQIGPLFSHPNFFPEACTQRKSHKLVLIIIHP